MISQLETTLGTTRYFGLADIGRAALRAGWAEPEAEHNWNDGYDATLTLRLQARPEADCDLIIEARPHLGAGLSRQDVTLYFNGHRLGFWRLDRLDGFSLRATIAPELWFTRGADVLGTCTWHLPQSTKPSALARTQDDRMLGLCFQSIRLETAEPMTA